MRSRVEGDYHIGDEIGSGRFGKVYRCTSAVTGDCFALKYVDKTSIADNVDLECIEREAKFMQLVTDHPNVVGFHGVYEDDESLHLVLDLCCGSDLYSRITQERRAPMSESEAVAVMRPLMEAIAHCHSRGVAHRDIKPDNVLFDESDRLKLADFGSAGWFGDGRLMEGLVGTPYYVAPEVVAGKDYGEKVDVWSAGVILYIMLTGIPPFYGETAVEIFQVVLRGNLRFPTRLFKGVSSQAKDLIRRMLSKDVSRRLSAEQVLRHPWMTSGGDARATPTVELN